MAFLNSFFDIALLVIGFGFVIFWHELGHFLAAKWVGIRVEQFAVGMGHAIFAFRRGIGWTWGSTQREYDRRVGQKLEGQGAPRVDYKDRRELPYADRDIFRAADELGLGETEYRIAWFPVGGYVKPYGQDDLDMSSRKDDPRSYSSKSVGQRMFVISAGVIMNVILAGILFMVLFLHGFRAPAPVVGSVLAGSPAQKAGVRVGDELLSYDGATMHDFTKVMLATALSKGNHDVTLRVRHPDGREEDLTVRPERALPDPKSFISIGVSGSAILEGPKEPNNTKHDPDLERPEYRALGPGDVVVAVNGQEVRPNQYYVFDRALQASSPENPVVLTVKNAAGQAREVKVEPRFMAIFGGESLQLAGMEPRMKVGYVSNPDAPAYGKVKPDDVILQVVVHAGEKNQVYRDPTIQDFLDLMKQVGPAGQTIDLVVQRDGKPVQIAGIAPAKIAKGQYGIGVAPYYDEEHLVVAKVAPDSPAARAGLPRGATITTVDGKKIGNWFDLRQQLLAGRGSKQTIGYTDPDGKDQTARIALDPEALERLASLRFGHDLTLAEMTRVRQTNNPLVAMGWGVTETRDLILQFYVTLRRMISGEVSPSNLMGPVGIFRAGAKFAHKGTDWLLWFLAMISANLAVVNFLPIPIVDGGHFVFLLIEKITGRPPSKRVLETAQLAGLVFILLVFAFVTWNDISR